MKKNFCSLSHIQLAFGFTLLASGVAIGQMRVITGTVTENLNHKPISGVSIFQEGSDAVAVSDGSGIYRVQVTGENPVLVFKHPDYPDRKVSLGNRVSVDVSLGKESDKGIGSENEKAIEEVVLNAGYYKVRDKERTGSISRVTAKDIENQPVTNVLASAQGRMSGVSITQNSGTPGGGFDIQIRGKNSIRREGNEPLYIIDGVPLGSETPSLYSVTILPNSSINPLNAINPNDIESFEVLKDADATAIYGSRGANGVIIVTTKKGRKGRTDLKLNSSYSLSTVASRMEMMSTSQYLQMRRQAFQNDGIATIPATAYDLNTWDQNRYTDWQKELIGRTADASVVQLSLSGGSDNSSYLISYGHQEQTTVFPADFRYRTNNITGNFSFRSPDKRLEVNMSNSFSFQNNNVQNDDLTRRSLTLSPNAPALYDASGNINWQNNTFANPVALFNSEYLNSTSFINSGTNISYRLFPFLSLKFNGGITYQNFEENSLKPHTMYNTSGGLTSANSISSRNDQTNFSYLLEPQITAEYGWNDHRFDVLIGTTLQQSEARQGSIQGIGFESNALIQNIGAAKTKIVSDQVNSQYFYTAAFARFNYQFKKRYIVNLTGRRDGSSRFGPDNRFGNFGAVGAAWIFSEESFMKHLRWLNFAKLRGSIGTTGNDKIGDYQYLNTYSVTANIYNGITGLSPSRLFNPNFSWEKTVKKEVAMELSFLNSRINMTAAYYNNSSSNQLVGIPLPATAGFASIQSNLPAKVRNTGWEFDLSAQVLKSSALKYETSLNVSVPRNKLLEFPNLAGSTYSNQYVIGYPMSLVKVYQFEGVDPATGLYRFRDFNGDGRVTSPDDNQVIEKIGVEYFGGWSNNLRFKQWSASFLFQFVKQRNWNYNRQMLIPGNMNNQPLEVLDAWSPSNPTGTYMQYSTGTIAQKNTLHSLFQNSTAAVGDASFIRLKNVQLNYSIPMQKFGIREAMIYVQGQNLITITNYFGLDPEFVVTGFLPPLKTYSLGFQLTF
ncbi:SusC/RagA family TonB-linked outer membrane protein [Chryseobacterium sp. LC2016-27]|uniref:SusC/RagA family TonB-linked outer membrane protein n=1 Tax=Chryseobacterium sp. LC2016-27 TaxID=2897326 RepID=UPI001E3A1777|nr:SusC/RagA family TonB-linked outer membrane protein [Chryseobacterium sp. LC2016-27]MCD0456330.1 SusC/RagA family TonB-linked outer membrane protein [Chryseobacterium sp. LC2016-27]